MWGALSFHWTIVQNNILPTRVLDFSEDASKGSVLGLVTVIGALVAMVTAPLAGVFSDESRLAWGRRRPFLVVGMACNIFALLALVGTRSLIGLVGAFAMIQFFVNLAAYPYTALLPDQVPAVQKGRATGLAGFFDVGGRLVGAIVGGLWVSLPGVAMVLGEVFAFLPGSVRESPMLPIVLLVISVTGGVMVYTAARVRETVPERPPVRDRRGLLRRAFFFDVRAESAFAWLLVSRAANMLGINTLTTFLLYYVRDYLDVPDIAEANAKLGCLFAASALTTLPSSLAVGYVLDRGQPCKPWIWAANAGLAAVAVAFVATTQFSIALVVAAAFGIFYGAYFTADWALALALLPKGDAAAKYMGIWGIAGMFPQVLAPGIGGVLLDAFNRVAHNGGYPVVFGTIVIYLVGGLAALGRVREPNSATHARSGHRGT